MKKVECEKLNIARIANTRITNNKEEQHRIFLTKDGAAYFKHILHDIKKVL